MEKTAKDLKFYLGTKSTEVKFSKGYKYQWKIIRGIKQEYWVYHTLNARPLLICKRSQNIVWPCEKATIFSLDLEGLWCIFALFPICWALFAS